MQFFKDGDGQLSSMRLIQISVVATILFTFILANFAMVFNAIRLHTPVAGIIDFPVQSVWLIGTILAGKVAQGFFVEKKDGANANTPSA